AVKPRYIDPDVEVEETSISWIKIAAWAVGLIVLSALIYYGIQYINGADATNEGPLIETAASDTLSQNQASYEDGTMVDSSNVALEDPQGLLTFDVILNTYT